MMALELVDNHGGRKRGYVSDTGEKCSPVMDVLRQIGDALSERDCLPLSYAMMTMTVLQELTQESIWALPENTTPPPPGALLREIHGMDVVVLEGPEDTRINVFSGRYLLFSLDYQTFGLREFDMAGQVVEEPRIGVLQLIS